MVKKTNVRLMLTVSPETSKKMKELCVFFDCTPTELFKFMVAVFHQERIEK